MKRPAVANWARRHSDFPRPILLNGGEVFDAEAMATWLDRRPVPVDALDAGEESGVTYGERFRRNFLAADDSPRRAQQPAAVKNEQESSAWQRIRNFDWQLNDSGYRLLVLGLIYLRSRLGPDWDAVLRDPSNVDAAVMRALDLQFPAMTRVPHRWRSAALSPGQFAEIARTVNELVGEIGDRKAFGLMLDHVSEVESTHGGDFYTPDSVAQVMAGVSSVRGRLRVHDPFCRVGELLVAAAEASGEVQEVSGFTYNDASRALADMNIAIHDIPGKATRRQVQEVIAERNPLIRFDRILCNPPFGMRLPSVGDGWRYGPPPANSANFAWMQHVIDSLTPNGRATVLMANGAAFSRNLKERRIRAGLVDDGCVEAVIALPRQLFRGTTIPVAMWLLTPPQGDRDEVLFGDASRLGQMSSRTVRVLAPDERDAIVDVVDRWRQGRSLKGSSLPASSVSRDVIRDHGYSLYPPEYVSLDTARVGPERRSIEELRRRLDELGRLANLADAKVDEELGRLRW